MMLSFALLVLPTRVPVLDVKDVANTPVYGYSTRYTGDITPAPLNFLADPALGLVGRNLPALSGTVSGFVAEESWPADWSTTVQSSSSPGSYPVYGMVASSNYYAVQAQGNDTVLTLMDGSPASPPQQAARAVEVLPLLIPPIGFATVGLADLSSLSHGNLFGPVNVRAMSSSDLAGLLASRHEFKPQLFVDSIAKLEIDPSLADVKSCLSAEEAGSGLCRITPELIADLQAKAVQLQPVDQVASPQHQPALPLIQRKIAVLFGINDYGDRRIPRLESAVPDVEAVSRVLVERLGYEVRVLRNSGKVDIIRTLNQVSIKARLADGVPIYYAGHGYSLEKHGGDEPVTDEGKEGHSIFAWNFMQLVNSVQGWTPGNSIFRQVQTAASARWRVPVRGPLKAFFDINPE